MYISTIGLIASTSVLFMCTHKMLLYIFKPSYINDIMQLWYEPHICMIPYMANI